MENKSINYNKPDVVLFVVQVILIFVVVCISLTNLSFGCDNPNLWTVLLTSCLGYIMPNPKIKVNDGNLLLEAKKVLSTEL